MISWLILKIHEVDYVRLKEKEKIVNAQSNMFKSFKDSVKFKFYDDF